MATRYHQQAYAHVRPPTRRQPLGPGDARANMHAQAYPTAEKPTRRPVPASPKDKNLPHNESLVENDTGVHVRSSPNESRGYKRVSDIKNQAQKSKRDSEISNASSTGSGGGRKRTIGQWQLGRTVGQGGCSTVRLVRHVVTGQQGAVKIISRKMAEQVRAQSLANLAASQEKSIQDLVAAGKIMAPPPPGLMREIAIMKLLDHPNIVRLYDVWENHNELYLVMEYVPGGELFHYVEEQRGLDEKETIYIFRQIVAALLYCHRMNIHHRDLKPENILLDRDNAQIKLVDFGMAALQPEGKQLTTACGSPHYAAPEVIRSRPYDGAKADVWSCGVILYVMLTGTTPFNYDHERNLAVMYAAIQAADYYMPPELSYQAKDLLRKIFITRPEKRISMDEIWDHPLLHKYDKDFGYEGELAKKDRWVGPAAILDEWTVTREDDIDKEILRNMRTLWHSVPQQTLIKKLLSNQPNQEKFFYAALAKHKEEHLENYTGGADGLGYAASDYQHARPESGEATRPQTQQASQSSYSIMGNEHLRSSSIADRVPSESSYDPYRSGRQSAAGRASQIPRGPGHKRGNSGSMKGAALRVEMLKKANQQAIARQKVSPAPGTHSRSVSHTSITKTTSRQNSRQSLTSSVWPSSPPVVVHVKTNSTHKRSVSFQHIRKSSTASVVTHSANNSTRHTATPDVDEQGEIIDETIEETVEEEEETSTHMSSPTRRVVKDAKHRKSKIPTGATPRSRQRKSDTPGSMMRTEVRKVSTELEKACEEAFFRSSYGSSTQTSTTDRHSSYDTPPSSVSGQANTSVHSPSGRPLPAVPTDTPNTFIARTIEETRKKLVERAAGGEADAAKINEVLASLEKIMPSEAERRSTSAPEPKSAADIGFLPIITEEPLPDTLRVGKGENKGPLPETLRVGKGDNKGPRSFTAPGPANTNAGAQKNKHDSIRVVDQSPITNHKVTSKRDSSMEKEVIVSRPKTADGTVPHDDKHLQVPNPYEYLLRKKSHDSAIGFKPTAEETQPVPAADPAGKKESSFWFRRWKKAPSAPASPPIDPHPGVPVHFKDLDDRKQKPSLLKRDKQPPQPLDLSKPDPPPGPSTDSSEFPIRRASDSEGKGFSKWLNKLGKKDDAPTRAIEIKGKHPLFLDSPVIMPPPFPAETRKPSTKGPGTSCLPFATPHLALHLPNLSKLTIPTEPLPSPGIPTPVAAEPSPKTTSPTTAVNAQSWFARFFRLQPPSHIMAFKVPRSRARGEIYRLLREFQHAGLGDLCYFPQENAITARVEKNNALGIKPVSFRVELFVVLQNGKRSGLSLGRWTMVRGAASGFERVVEAVERCMEMKGVLVEEEGRREELRGILA
ncbi:protein kinase domain-containing protein 50 [Elsinoe australis]|uniref:non-specific serine/threonine protein kinase n=1 Tax=Elsinoe australis TaxID=40998 RepID=A0A4U7ALN6_9PEZI|nr:protein kinase domain-containing protein 50 [Elsinoe australis]